MQTRTSAFDLGMRGSGVETLSVLAFKDSLDNSTRTSLPVTLGRTFMFTIQDVSAHLLAVTVGVPVLDSW